MSVCCTSVIIRYVLSKHRRESTGDWRAAASWLPDADAARCHSLLRHQVSFHSVTLDTTKLTEIVWMLKFYAFALETRLSASDSLAAYDATCSSVLID